MENHFSAGDASLEEKERALNADAAPGDKNLLLHYPDRREAESSEQTTTGAPPAATGLGSEPEASLSNASASESAPPGDAAGTGEEVEGPPAAGTLLPGGDEGPTEEERPELSLGEGPGEEEAGLGHPTLGTSSGEAEGQEESDKEARGVLSDSSMQGAAAGVTEPEAVEATPSIEDEEVHTPEAAGEGSPGPDHQLVEPNGAPITTSAGEELENDKDTEAGEGAKDQPQPQADALEAEGEGSPGPDHPTAELDGIPVAMPMGGELEAEKDTETGEGSKSLGEPSLSQEAGPAAEASEESGGTQSSSTGETLEDHPPEGQAPGMSEENPDEASSEEEGGEEGGSEEEGGVPSKEESGEDSGDGASSEEEGGTSKEAGEPQEAAEATSSGQEGAQLGTEELNTGSEGGKAQDPDAEEPEEGHQGRGNPVIAPQGRN